MDNLSKVKSDTNDHADKQQDLILPVIKEDVIIGKRILKKGRVVIEKKISSEEISVEVPLMTEQTDIQRISVNQYLDSSPEIRYEGNTLIIPVIKEVMVKKILLVEEIRVTKHVQNINKTENYTIRKEEVYISRKEE